MSTRYFRLASCAVLVGLLAGGCAFKTIGATPTAGGPDGGTIRLEGGAREKPPSRPDGYPEDAPSSPDDPRFCPVADFVPTWRPPTSLGQHRCTDAQVEAILACLLDSTADVAACKAVTADANNKDCSACLNPSAATSKSYGPLTLGDGFISLNQAGCVALLEPDVTAHGCGARFQAFDECQQVACCNQPVTDDATFAAQQKCVNAAAATVCKTYAADAVCLDDLVKPGAVAAICDVNAGDFIENAVMYGKLFCASGPAPTDAGTDAPSDG